MCPQGRESSGGCRGRGCHQCLAGVQVQEEARADGELVALGHEEGVEHELGPVVHIRLHAPQP